MFDAFSRRTIDTMIAPRLLAILLAAPLIATASGGARAQLVLPGAVQAGPAAPSAKPRPAETAPRKPVAVAVKTPAEETILGQELLLNGRGGRIVFSRAGADLVVARLTLEGAQISRPDDACRVEVASGGPLPVTLIGKPKGAQRYQINFEACPFSFDVLEGAILAAPMSAMCEIKAADCRVDPAGLWGPRASAFSAERAKEIERGRIKAEATMRENFKVLLADSHGKAEIKAAASGQAGFSSERSTICRDYAGEDKHGFCSLKLTEARALALRAAIGEAVAEAPARRKPKRQ